MGAMGRHQSFAPAQTETESSRERSDSQQQIAVVKEDFEQDTRSGNGFFKECQLMPRQGKNVEMLKRMSPTTLHEIDHS